eukprot:TRINITY_DN32699_c0_g1_i1.p1 TRINITY_DN32699_c0_g1~~TRINITY_DN32699_c0_g1_i1.p1  ORF type:complete len:198 (-),score=36.14 TRINITY_DN32699_c0_g1_i1:10-603(-)
MPPAPEDFLDIPLLDTWRAMEALVDSGLVRAIGVSNFSVQKLQQLLPLVRILPAVNQVEGHPYLQQLALKEFCDRNGIVMTCYAPLGSGDRPARLKDEGDPVLMEDETLLKVAEELGRTPAEVLLRWGVQRGTGVIPKSVTPERITSNLLACATPLPEEALRALGKMERQLRFFKGLAWVPDGTAGPLKTLEDLWGD